MPKPPTHASSMRRLRATERQLQALALRRAGAPYELIARRLGYANRSNAYRAVRQLLERQVSEEVAEYRYMNLERLERMVEGVWDRGTSGDNTAVRLLLRIIAAENRMLGIGASPTLKRPEPVCEPTPVVQWPSDEEWMRRFREAWDEVASETEA